MSLRDYHSGQMSPARGAAGWAPSHAQSANIPAAKRSARPRPRPRVSICTRARRRKQRGEGAGEARRTFRAVFASGVQHTSSSAHGFAASLTVSDSGIRMSLRCACSSRRTCWKRDEGARSSDGRSWKEEGSAPRTTTSQSSASVAPSRRSSTPPATIADGNPCALSQHTSIFLSHSATVP